MTKEEFNKRFNFNLKKEEKKRKKEEFNKRFNYILKGEK